MCIAKSQVVVFCAHAPIGSEDRSRHLLVYHSKSLVQDTYDKQEPMTTSKV